MRKYLSELHNKSDRHKKRFAFLISGAITLAIFSFWSLATFGISKEIVANNEDTRKVSIEADNEVSPFESLRMNLAASFEAFKSNLGELGSEVKSVDFESEYQEMRDGALDVYGQ